MPYLSKLFIRFSLIYLVLGGFFGMFVALGKIFDFPSLRSFLQAFLPLHITFMIFGWFMNFIFGVMFWIFPRLQGGVSRGNIKLYSLSFLTLNLGILTYSFSHLLSFFGGGDPISYRLTLLPSAFFVIGVFVFIIAVLPRVRPPSKPF